MYQCEFTMKIPSVLRTLQICLVLLVFMFCAILILLQFNSASNASFKSAKVTMKNSKMLKSKCPWHGEFDKMTPVAEVL